MSTIKPTYYVRHPDATYSVADPQPTIQPVKQELVAWRNAIKHWAFDCAWNDLTERQIDDLELLVIGVLNAAPVDAKAIRAMGKA